MKSHYLYIEPYIHISHDNKTSLYYNPLNKQKYISESLTLLNLTKELYNKENSSRIIELDKVILENNEINDFIKNIKSKFIGDLIPINKNRIKPICKKQDISFEFPHGKIKDIEFSYENKKELKNQIFEISFFINTNGGTVYKKAHLQFLCNYNIDVEYNEIDIEKIRKMLFNVSSTRYFQAINILGGNILLYSKLRNLINILNDNPFVISYFLYYNDINFDQNVDTLLNSVNNNKSIFNIFIKPSSISDEINNLFKYFNKQNTCLDFIIENENDFEKAEKFLEKFSFKNYKFHPYYNGKNYKFFESNVFLTKEEIEQLQPEEKELYVNKHLNDNFYGKLMVLPNENVYSNLNKNKIGNINKNNLHELIYNELKNENCWTLKRENVSPCKNCCFNYFCPPISNYEFIMGKYNLCHYK